MKYCVVLICCLAIFAATTVLAAGNIITRELKLTCPTPCSGQINCPNGSVAVCVQNVCACVAAASVKKALE